jgi:hypothetical protein
VSVGNDNNSVRVNCAIRISRCLEACCVRVIAICCCEAIACVSTSRRSYNEQAARNACQPLSFCTLSASSTFLPPFPMVHIRLSIWEIEQQGKVNWAGSAKHSLFVKLHLISTFSRTFIGTPARHPIILFHYSRYPQVYNIKLILQLLYFGVVYCYQVERRANTSG